MGVTSVVDYRATRNAYAASDLTTYACSALLIEQRESDPRVSLLRELETRSNDGQERYITNPHLIVNALVLWPGGHRGTDWEMAFKLLGSVVSFAKQHNMPIWTPIPRNQMR